MNKNLELTSEDLRIHYDNLPDFKTTKDIKPYKNIIGQNAAAKSIDLGLKINRKGFNIFISGHSGTGKTEYIVNKIKEYAKDMETPLDYCFVYNFNSPYKPMTLPLKTGTANEFKEDVDNLIKYVIKEVPIYFNSKDYTHEKDALVDEGDDKIYELNQELFNKAAENGLSIHKSPADEFVFSPMKDGREMTDEEFADLSDKEKEDLSVAAGELRAFAYEMLKTSKVISKELDEKLSALDSKVTEAILHHNVKKLIKKYSYEEKITEYLTCLKQDIIDNIGDFMEDSENPKEDKSFLIKYQVNVFITNEQGSGAPIVFADSTEYPDLFGKMEYVNRDGALFTDFTCIKPGSLHKANGGFVIIKSPEILSDGLSWTTLKRVLNLQSISIINPKSDYAPIETFAPEATPVNTKVILLGSDYIYSKLLAADEEFHKYFKIKAEFDNEIECKEDNILQLIGFITNYTEKNNLLPVDRDGVIELVKYSTRLVERKNYFSSSISDLLKILNIADYFAGVDGNTVITKENVLKAIEEDNNMHSLVKQKISEMYTSGKYVVHLKGSKVGEINGLSIADYGDCVVGQQHRITVTTFAGRKGIINIEREASLSGSIHNKGILILSGFIGDLVGQTAPPSFNASIVFEQLYSHIEGDSASTAELLALLSSLSGVPLKQSYAITGSVNQRGEIQPIGGVNKKIEGFFNICSLFGLDGTQGVIIPESNVDELVLEDNIVDAIEKGLFHIYAVSNVSQCLSLFCDDEYRASLEDNSPSGILNDIKNRILEKLNNYEKVLNKEPVLS